MKASDNHPTPEFLELHLKLKGIWQKKALGQHFLFNTMILERIAALAQADGRTLALEIGPGAGTLTTTLARHGGAVMAVEFDQRFRPLHDEVFGPFPDIRFHYADALRTDLAGLAREAAAALGRDRLTLTGNLPFQITSPLLFDQCNAAAPWHRIVVMVQREVADRIVSPPRHKAYGILSVKLAYWWKLVERFEVSASAFRPPPKVDASVLAFEPLADDQRPGDEEWASLSRFVDAAFGQRRKTLGNALAGGWPAFPGRDAYLAALARLRLAERARAEDLTPDQLRRLHQVLRDR
jgi:16S rRNA (adenine1518-N6/adenine1519-N6)-dimethyltransferase